MVGIDCGAFRVKSILIVGLLLVSCSLIRKPIVDVNMSSCDMACNKIIELGCLGAKGSPGLDEEFGTADDMSCNDVCRWVMSEDPTARHLPGCTAKADSCVAVEQCFDIELEIGGG